MTQLEFSIGMFHTILMEIAGNSTANGKKATAKSSSNSMRNNFEFQKLVRDVEAEMNCIRIGQRGKTKADRHPKMAKTLELLLQHFTEAEDDETIHGVKNDTRAMVFCSYRECVMEIVVSDATTQAALDLTNTGHAQRSCGNSQSNEVRGPKSRQTRSRQGLQSERAEKGMRRCRHRSIYAERSRPLPTSKRANSTSLCPLRSVRKDWTLAKSTLWSSTTCPSSRSSCCNGSVERDASVMAKFMYSCLKDERMPTGTRLSRPTERYKKRFFIRAIWSSSRMLRGFCRVTRCQLVSSKRCLWIHGILKIRRARNG